MDIDRATRKYETWLGKRIVLVGEDLALKHRQMASAPFPFLRATFYCWAHLWPQFCPDLAKAPAVLAVGDLHVENFGTWRDSEGRLVWGVNDLDEASWLSYANDLVRLAVSARFACEARGLSLPCGDACSAILQGYTEGLEAGGRPYTLAEQHGWLRELATGALRDPVAFWNKMDGLPDVLGAVPASAREGLESLLPERGLKYRLAHRVAGLGSLGRQRFVAIAEWRGGRIAREAKALAPSAAAWAAGAEGPKEILYQALLTRAVRCRDPFVELRGQWIVRRLAPDCSRIELSALPGVRDEERLLHAMGWETANIHLGSPEAIDAVRRDLASRPDGWLHAAEKAMAEAMMAAWRDWQAVDRDRA